jgi:hypothetical protein
MSRTDWDSAHADLDGLTDEGKRTGQELTGRDAPSLQEVLRAAWGQQEEWSGPESAVKVLWH